MRIRGYFSKSEELREPKSLGNTRLKHGPPYLIRQGAAPVTAG